MSSANTKYLPDYVADYALYKGLIEDDVDALWAGLRQSVRLRYALLDPKHYHPEPSDYTHVWNIVPALAVGEADIFEKWVSHVPAKLTSGHAWTVAVSNAVTAIGRSDEGLMSASLGELQKQLLGRGLGDYQRALLELLCGAIKGDDVRVGGAIEASVKAWPRYFKSNRWRIDWFLALDTIAFFNLTRTLIDAPIATLKHERWRTPPPDVDRSGQTALGLLGSPSSHRQVVARLSCARGSERVGVMGR